MEGTKSDSAGVEPRRDFARVLKDENQAIGKKLEDLKENGESPKTPEEIGKINDLLTRFAAENARRIDSLENEIAAILRGEDVGTLAGMPKEEYTEEVQGAGFASTGAQNDFEAIGAESVTGESDVSVDAAAQSQARGRYYPGQKGGSVLTPKDLEEVGFLNPHGDQQQQ